MHYANQTDILTIQPPFRHIKLARLLISAQLSQL